MKNKIPRIALIGERDPAKTAHLGIEASLALYHQETDSLIEYEWVDTVTITAESAPGIFQEMTGIWCTPGSPYANTGGALRAIQLARTGPKAFLGTCGGFQHALMEFAENVLGHPAVHEELTPGAKDPLIAKLSCSLAGAKGRVMATRPGRFAEISGATETIEEFNCNYGINEGLAGIFQGSDLAFVAHDETGQVRAFRLDHHPFFVGTLFQPERKALTGALHPVVRAFLAAA